MRMASSPLPPVLYLVLGCVVGSGLLQMIGFCHRSIRSGGIMLSADVVWAHRNCRLYAQRMRMVVPVLLLTVSMGAFEWCVAQVRQMPIDMFTCVGPHHFLQLFLHAP